MVTPSANARRARTNTSGQKTSRHPPARKRTCEFLFSGTLSERSHGCIPRKLMMFPTASSSYGRQGESLFLLKVVSDFVPRRSKVGFQNLLDVVGDRHLQILQLETRRQEDRDHERDGRTRKKNQEE
ncbi:hypothetical protein EYF80_040444 [Liparis tanakae]|uniref:Uncharacterized protein n=1 Tax=Liparis tanakae TaxID=230148 RepID=A0A4Z2G947_9TELE|nr:hypothetical protein EYF80_040444 [Liparis tanakae]